MHYLHVSDSHQSKHDEPCLTDMGSFSEDFSNYWTAVMFFKASVSTAVDLLLACYLD
jgi:hypothetical protein